MNLNINIDDSVVSKVKVKADPALNNLCGLRLVGVAITELVSTDSKEEYQYHGMTIPNIVFNFEQDHSDKVERFLDFTLGPVVLIKNDGEINPVKTVNNIYLSQYKHVRHIYDAFASLPNTKPLTKLPKLKTDGVTPEQHIKDLMKWYETLVSWFTGKDEKGIYLNGKGDSYKLIAKLLINKNSKTIDVPNYINDGFIELMKIENGKLVTGLEIKPNEAVVFTPVTNGMPGMDTSVPGGAPQGSVEVDDL